MEAQERAALIDQLDRSFTMMPTWAKAAAKHAMGAPEINPATGRPFASFRQVIEAASDQTLEILRDDFADNGDLLPAALADHIEHGGWRCDFCGYDGQDNQRYNQFCARCRVHR